MRIFYAQEMKETPKAHGVLCFVVFTKYTFTYLYLYDGRWWHIPLGHFSYIGGTIFLEMHFCTDSISGPLFFGHPVYGY